MNIKQIRQDAADNNAKQATLKAEGRKLMAVASKDRTPEQTARLDAVSSEMDALAASAVTIAIDLARAERFADDERRSGDPAIRMGLDHAAVRVWGPTLHSDATPAMRIDARQAALGEFAIAVKGAMSGQAADPRLFAAATGMGSQVPSDGGFAVPMEVAAGIERNMYETGDLLGRVDARTITGDAIAYNVIDESSRADGSRQGGVRHYWVDQGVAPTASRPKLARVEMKLRKVGALGYMTDELVSDAAALGGELEAMFTEELVFGVEDAITEGTGAGQPHGYTVAPCLVSQAKETGQAAATIAHANLVKMSARMRPSDFKAAVWLANIDTKPQLHTLTMPAGTSALEPRFVNYGNDGSLSIFGLPVVFTEYNATVGTVGDLVLINLKKYRLIRKGGVEQASSIHVLFTTGEQTFRAFYRCDGQMMPRSALTPFKGSSTTTLSPVVVLATRA